MAVIFLFVGLFWINNIFVDLIVDSSGIFVAEIMNDGDVCLAVVCPKNISIIWD